MRLGAQTARDFNQALGIRTVVGADDQKQVGVGGYVLHRHLAIFCGVANVLRGRALDVWELRGQSGDDVARFIKAEGRLGQVRDAVGIGDRNRLDFRGRTDNLCHSRRLAQRTDDLIMIAVPDQDQRISLLGKLDRLDVHLCDQRAGGVDHAELANFAARADFGRNAVGAVNDAFAFGDLVDAVDEDRTLLLQFFDYETVVNDLLADVNRRPKGFERNTNNIDRAHHPGAETPRLQKQ